ncbi:hypothetical protein CDL15_Pgr013714 [Punica granatum]|uniref:Uncharacterized protein n=1 Tax=Punica granatum TaxID=22663 RepID=A0A218W0Z7_PUNGR|nr:hypothetical protein CDL15_Pgr013714 [Punica granatum]
MGDPGERQPLPVGEKQVGMLSPVTAGYKVGLVGLLRGRSTRPWVDPSVPRPEQTRKCERKLGKNEENPVREKRVNGGCARLIGPRTVTTSSRGRVRVVRNPLDVMARLAENRKSKPGNGLRGWEICGIGKFDDFWLKPGRVVTGIPGGFPMVLAGFGLGLGWTKVGERAEA